MVRIAILRLLESYFRHRWLYLVPILLFTVAGAVYVFTAETNYIAGGVLYVQNDSFLGSLTSVRDVPFTFKTPAQRTSDQIMDLMQTDAFVRSIIEETGLESAMSQGEQAVFETMEEVRESVWTRTIGDNQVGVYTSHSNPTVAMELSTSVINRYIQWQINLDRVQSSAAEDFMEELVDKYNIELEEARDNLEQYLEAHPQPLRGERPDAELLEIDRLQSSLQLAGQRYSNALEQLEGARLATSQAEADIRQTYFIVDSPRLPDSPTSSLRQLAMNGIVFVAVGLIFTGVGIAGGALLDRSFRFPVDVDHALGLPVVSMFPDVQPKSSRLSFLRRRSKEPADDKVNQKVNNPLVEDEIVEVAA